MSAEARSLGCYRAVPGTVTSLSPRTCLLLSGMGAERARNALLTLYRQGLRYVINWGVAGGLRTDLRVGDLCIPTETTDGGIPLSQDGAWRQELCAHLQAEGQSLRAGRLYSSSRMLTTPQQRLSAARTAGADAVDMEGHSLAQTARSLGVQLLLVKVIVDEWDTLLPRCIEQHTDALGHPVFPGFVVSLLCRPSDWPRLWCVSRDFRRALGCLHRLGTLLHKQSFCLPD